MALEALKKFADELKTIRESKTITLQQIAGKTKIDLKFLQAIEDANFDVLPELYIRAFIKEYSQTIDLNPKEILQKFDNAKSGRQDEKPAEAVHVEIQPKVELVKEEGVTSPHELAQSTPTAFNAEEPISTPADIPEVKTMGGIKTNYIIGGVISVVAILIIYFAFISGSSSDIIKVTSDSETVKSDSERFEIERRTPAQSESEITIPVGTAPLSTDSLHLSVLITDRVWVKVSSDGKILQQGVVETNSRMSFAAKKNFSFSVGNAGHVKLYFNNKLIENVGNPGEIRNLFITSDGIKYYTISPQKNEKKSPKAN